MVCPQCNYANEQGLSACEKCSTPLLSDDATLTEDTLDAGSAAPLDLSEGGGQLSPGMVLAQRYEITRLLGQGGMGAVYQARDRELDRTVALKIIRADMARNPQAFQRFKQETILARQVTHRNVIRIFDLGQSGGIKFITMEYIEGEGLQRLLAKKTKLEPREAAKIMAQIAAALEAAHAEGVVHRDLKPQNIMVDASGRVYVMDFGIARSADSHMTRTGAIIGTPHYMSPEQAMGQTVDLRSDIFSAGIIFYEMLSRKSPFAGENGAAGLWKRASEPARPVQEVDSTIPQPLSDIVGKCLQINPENRYASASELLRDLNIWLGPGEQVFAQARRPAYITVLIATSMAIAGIAAAWLGWRILQRPAQPRSTVSVLIADFDNQTGDAVFDGTLEPVLSLALEGAPFISSYSRGGARKIAVRLDPNLAKMDAATAEVVALREGVDVVLAGAIAKEGSGYRVSLSSLDPATGKPLLQDQGIYAANKQAVLVVASQLADRIRRGLGDKTPSSVLQSQAETYTAGSLEAAHAYAVGQDLQQQARWAEAIQAYERAISLDPNMGRAYAGAAVMYANLGRRQEADKNFQLAMARIDRMTDREKYRTRGAYYLAVRNPAKAIGEYTFLVTQYPADTAGHPNLALAYFLQRDMSKAVEEQKKVVAMASKSVQQRSNLSLYELYAGNFDEAAKEAQRLLQDNPKFEVGVRTLGLAKLAAGRTEEAMQEFTRLESMSPRGASMARAALADLAWYQGSLQSAAAQLQKGIALDVAAKDSDAVAQGRVNVGLIQAALGINKKQAESMARDVAAASDESVLYRAAQVFISLGQDAPAQQLINRLAARLEIDPQLYAKLLTGEMQLKHGRPREALGSFQDAQKLSDSWLGRLDLGKAHLQAGEFREAAEEFDLCLKRRGEATSVFLDDLPSYHLFPAAYYYQGRAREGLAADAAESYQTFLATKEKSSDDPLVADAKLRLQGLPRVAQSAR